MEHVFTSMCWLLHALPADDSYNQATGGRSQASLKCIIYFRKWAFALYSPAAGNKQSHSFSFPEGKKKTNCWFWFGCDLMWGWPRWPSAFAWTSTAITSHVFKYIRTAEAYIPYIWRLCWWTTKKLVIMIKTGRCNDEKVWSLCCFVHLQGPFLADEGSIFICRGSWVLLLPSRAQLKSPPSLYRLYVSFPNGLCVISIRLF